MQDIDAPFENLLKLLSGFRFMFTMQKDLSEWINISSMKIDDDVLDELNKSVIQE